MEFAESVVFLEWRGQPVKFCSEKREEKKILNSHGDGIRMCMVFYEYLCDEMKCRK